MDKGQVFASRKDFIENGVGQLMSAKKDFRSIQYAISSVTEQEYVRVMDVFGGAITIDITGDDLEKVLSDMSRVILMGEENVHAPAGIVTDRDLLRKISNLFN